MYFCEGPCAEEIPALQRLYRRWGDPFYPTSLFFFLPYPRSFTQTSATSHVDLVGLFESDRYHRRLGFG